VDSLFRIVQTERTKAAAPPPPRPGNKRVWASLLKGKSAVIDEVVAEVARRDPGNVKIHVALTDGERALQILVGNKMKGTLIFGLAPCAGEGLESRACLSP